MSIWHRNVPWATGDHGRTDIQTTTLQSVTIIAARYALKDGPIVQIPMDDLRIALEHAPTRRDGTIVGPYNIFPFKQQIEVSRHSTRVRMDFGPFADLDQHRVTTYHGNKPTPADQSRPRVPHDFFGFAETVIEKVLRDRTGDQHQTRALCAVFHLEGIAGGSFRRQRHLRNAHDESGAVNANLRQDGRGR